MIRTLLTRKQREEMICNGLAQREASNKGESIDFNPVVKLFTPNGNCTWLLTELYPADHDVAFGLCDLGMGFPELGDVRISEIESITGPSWLSVVRDLHFHADKPLSEYANEARTEQRIIA